MSSKRSRQQAKLSKQVRDTRYRLRQRAEKLLEREKATGDTYRIQVARQYKQTVEQYIKVSKRSMLVTKQDYAHMDAATRERVKKQQAQQKRAETLAQKRFLKKAATLTMKNFDKNMNKQLMVKRKLSQPQGQSEKLASHLFYALTKDLWMGKPKEQRDELIIRGLGVPDIATAYEVINRSISAERKRTLANLSSFTETEAQGIRDWGYGKDSTDEAYWLMYNINMSARDANTAIPDVLNPQKVLNRRERYGLA